MLIMAILLNTAMPPPPPPPPAPSLVQVDREDGEGEEGKEEEGNLTAKSRQVREEIVLNSLALFALESKTT